LEESLTLEAERAKRNNGSFRTYPKNIMLSKI